MKVTWELHPDLDGVVHVHPVGRLDAYGSGPFFDAVAPLLTREHPHLLVDLGRVEHMSSDGVGVMVRLLSRVRGQGAMMASYGADHRVRSVIRVVDLERAFLLRDDARDAAATLKEKGAGL